MGVAANPLIAFEHTYAAAVEELVVPWQGASAPTASGC